MNLFPSQVRKKKQSLSEGLSAPEICELPEGTECLLFIFVSLIIGMWRSAMKLQEKLVKKVISSLGFVKCLKNTDF